MAQIEKNLLGSVFPRLLLSVLQALCIFSWNLAEAYPARVEPANGIPLRENPDPTARVLTHFPRGIILEVRIPKPSPSTGTGTQEVRWLQVEDYAMGKCQQGWVDARNLAFDGTHRSHLLGYYRGLRFRPPQFCDEKFRTLRHLNRTLEFQGFSINRHYFAQIHPSVNEHSFLWIAGPDVLCFLACFRGREGVQKFSMEIEIRLVNAGKAPMSCDDETAEYQQFVITRVRAGRQDSKQWFSREVGRLGGEEAVAREYQGLIEACEVVEEGPGKRSPPP